MGLLRDAVGLAPSRPRGAVLEGLEGWGGPREIHGVWGELSPVWVRMGWARGPLLGAEATRDPREPPQFPLVWSQPDGDPFSS